MHLSFISTLHLSFDALFSERNDVFYFSGLLDEEVSLLKVLNITSLSFGNFVPLQSFPLNSNIVFGSAFKNIPVSSALKMSLNRIFPKEMVKRPSSWTLVQCLLERIPQKWFYD